VRLFLIVAGKPSEKKWVEGNILLEVLCPRAAASLERLLAA
jgi:hypothetical protein